MRIQTLTKCFGGVLLMGAIQTSMALVQVEKVPWTPFGITTTGLPVRGHIVCSSAEHFTKVTGKKAPNIDWSNSHLIGYSYGMPSGNDWKLKFDRVELHTITVAGKPVRKILAITVVPYRFGTLYQLGSDLRTATTPAASVKVDIPATAYDSIEFTVSEYPLSDQVYLIKEPMPEYRIMAYAGYGGKGKATEGGK